MVAVLGLCDLVHFQVNALNQGRQYTTDPPQARRVAAVIEQEDVGCTMPMYLGQSDYTFTKDDVGRLIETTENMSPGFFSWKFGSIFDDLRKQYPDPFPYIGAPSAKE